MKVNKEKLEGNEVKLEVEVEEERVEKALNQAYKEVVKEINIPGFRKGKVPRKVLEKQFGEEILHKDALDMLIPAAYQEAVEEAEINPIDQPDITDYFIKGGEPATFTAEVEVEPEVKLGDYKDLEVEKEEIKIDEEQVEQELDARRHRNAQLVGVDRETVENGDFVTIDFEGSINGEPFEGGAAEDYNLEIGSGQFIPGFEDQLVGTKVGQETTIEVTFPEDYQSEDLAGKEAEFEVKIKDIKEKEIPELDDEFAKDLEFDSLEELKEDVRENLREREENRIEREYENKLVEAATDKVEVDIPEKMIEDEVEQMINQMKMQSQQQGFDFDEYLKMSGMDEEELRENHREEAEKRVKSNLALEAIADKEGIEVTEEEVDEQIEEIADQQDQDKEQIKAFLQMQGQLDMLRENLKRKKAIDFLAENN